MTTDLIVQVRARREARRACVSDDIALLNEASSRQFTSETLKMRVARAVSARMLDLDQVPIAAARCCPGDYPISRCAHRCTWGSTIVDSCVWEDTVQNRVIALASECRSYL